VKHCQSGQFRALSHCCRARVLCLGSLFELVVSSNPCQLAIIGCYTESVSKPDTQICRVYQAGCRRVIDGLFSLYVAYKPRRWLCSFLAIAGGCSAKVLCALSGVRLSGLCRVCQRRMAGRYKGSGSRGLARDKIMEPLALALILGGALGNLYDRIVHGHVGRFYSGALAAKLVFPRHSISPIAPL